MNDTVDAGIGVINPHVSTCATRRIGRDDANTRLEHAERLTDALGAKAGQVGAAVAVARIRLHVRGTIPDVSRVRELLAELDDIRSEIESLVNVAAN